METIKINTNGYMTVSEFQIKHGIRSKKTVYNMIQDGRVEARKILGKTVVKFK